MTHTSREYAEALFGLAADAGQTEAFADGLTLVEEQLDENPGFTDMLASPAISREERADALSRAFEGKIPLGELIWLRMMVSRGHARRLRETFACFRELARERRGESTARVTSAVALTEDEAERLRAKLEERFGKKMILERAVDPALLGGIRVETEGRVLDGSLRTRLQEIKEVMDS